MVIRLDIKLYKLDAKHSEWIKYKYNFLYYFKLYVVKMN